jgi:prepilin-type N-terminal cleavage/methylation domain-containing protein
MKEKGFSLVELLLVVVVIGIIVAIAIPNLLAARRASNEGSAISTLRSLHGAQATYASSFGSGNYAGTAGTLGIAPLTDLNQANLIDGVLGDGVKSGYSFVGDCVAAASGTPASFHFSANPTTPSGAIRSGIRRAGVATDGVIRADAAEADLGTPFTAAALAAAQSF